MAALWAVLLYRNFSVREKQEKCKSFPEKYCGKKITLTFWSLFAVVKKLPFYYNYSVIKKKDV